MEGREGKVMNSKKEQRMKGQVRRVGEGKFFELEMTVRDCELDQYGVVNNAVYAAYIETARQEMIASLGVCTASIARAGRAMALSELNIKYFAPLKRGAKFVVMVRVVGIKGVRMLMEHLIATLPERKQLVLEAMATVVCLNEDYRPTRMHVPGDGESAALLLSIILTIRIDHHALNYGKARCMICC
ncbi:hypothetical protein C2845_PMPSC002142 [Panicum miliaceum]|uniref:Uncharacterized protein n=1 Tax=Panicum miliaceum TaxID=4540 RepID=A0A3L6PCA9_PANMI|nr:hypothetical protein C2845_PMPSC002142 [Panicum miliaceum]